MHSTPECSDEQLVSRFDRKRGKSDLMDEISIAASKIDKIDSFIVSLNFRRPVLFIDYLFTDMNFEKIEMDLLYLDALDFQAFWYKKLLFE